MYLVCRLLLDDTVPRPPRSSPTRRSSDLLEGGRLPPALLAVGARQRAPRLRRPPRPRGHLRPHRIDRDRPPTTAADPRQDQDFTREGKRGDRKSTRLNSSHRCISYAVFCLTTPSPDPHALPLHDALPISLKGAACHRRSLPSGPASAPPGFGARHVPAATCAHTASTGIGPRPPPPTRGRTRTSPGRVRGEIGRAHV